MVREMNRNELVEDYRTTLMKSDKDIEQLIELASELLADSSGVAERIRELKADADKFAGINGFLMESLRSIFIEFKKLESESSRKPKDVWSKIMKYL